MDDLYLHDISIIFTSHSIKFYQLNSFAIDNLKNIYFYLLLQPTKKKKLYNKPENLYLLLFSGETDYGKLFFLVRPNKIDQ